MATEPPQLLLDVVKTYEKVGRLVQLALAGTDLLPEDYALFSLIYAEGPFTPTELARRLEMPLTTILFRIRRLEAAGHVERAPNPRDRRSFLIRLTPKGRRLARSVGPRFRRRADAVFARLGARKRRALEGGLAELRAAVDEQLET